MKIAIHQHNFVPWFPFFYKMAMADRFVLLGGVQFEKNGYQNRFKYKDRWITKPVDNGVDFIYEKHYVSGKSLKDLNREWIYVLRNTLDINTEIYENMSVRHNESKSEYLARIIKFHGGDTYITNPEAKDKYLDESVLRDDGIDIEYCRVPRNLNRSTFEIIEEFGITGAIRQLPKKESLCKV